MMIDGSCYHLFLLFLPSAFRSTYKICYSGFIYTLTALYIVEGFKVDGCFLFFLHYCTFSVICIDPLFPFIVHHIYKI